jgi:hypothetical protein
MWCSLGTVGLLKRPNGTLTGRINESLETLLLEHFPQLLPLQPTKQNKDLTTP